MGDGLKRAFAAARATRRSPRPKPAGPSREEVEAAAKELVLRYGLSPDAAWSGTHPVTKRHYRKVARAAIRAAAKARESK